MSKRVKREKVVATVKARTLELENGWVHLLITFPLGSGSDLHRWGIIQHLKAQAVGPEREAFELFPAASRAATDGNVRHLYVLPEGVHLPVGMTKEGISVWAAKAKPPQDVLKLASRSRVAAPEGLRELVKPKAVKVSRRPR